MNGSLWWSVADLGSIPTSSLLLCLGSLQDLPKDHAFSVDSFLSRPKLFHRQPSRFRPPLRSSVLGQKTPLTQSSCLPPPSKLDPPELVFKLHPTARSEISYYRKVVSLRIITSSFMPLRPFEGSLSPRRSITEALTPTSPTTISFRFKPPKDMSSLRFMQSIPTKPSTVVPHFWVLMSPEQPPLLDPPDPPDPPDCPSGFLQPPSMYIKGSEPSSDDLFLISSMTVSMEQRPRLGSAKAPRLQHGNGGVQSSVLTNVLALPWELVKLISIGCFEVLEVFFAYPMENQSMRSFSLFSQDTPFPYYDSPPPPSLQISTSTHQAAVTIVMDRVNYSVMDSHSPIVQVNAKSSQLGFFHQGFYGAKQHGINLCLLTTVKPIVQECCFASSALDYHTAASLTHYAVSSIDGSSQSRIKLLEFLIAYFSVISSQIGFRSLNVVYGSGASHLKFLPVNIATCSYRCFNVVFDYLLFERTITMGTKMELLFEFLHFAEHDSPLIGYIFSCFVLFSSLLLPSSMSPGSSAIVNVYVL